MVANDDPALAMVELERAKKLGHVGIMTPTVAGEGVPQYHARGMDPLWEAAVANDMAVNLHAGTDRARNTTPSLIQVSGGSLTTKTLRKCEAFVTLMLNMDSRTNVVKEKKEEV